MNRPPRPAYCGLGITLPQEEQDLHSAAANGSRAAGFGFALKFCSRQREQNQPGSAQNKTGGRGGRQRVNVQTKTLETELGTDGGAQIVVCATVKENIVAHFRPQPDPVSEHFNSAARIDREIRSPIR